MSDVKPKPMKRWACDCKDGRVFYAYARDDYAVHDTFVAHGICDFTTRLATDERDGAEQPEGRDAP